MSQDHVIDEGLDLSQVRSVHLGGMIMDNDAPSYDTHEDPFVILQGGAKIYVSSQLAEKAQRYLADHDYDDGFDYSVMG